MCEITRVMSVTCKVSRTLGTEETKKKAQKLFDKLVEYDDGENVRVGYFRVIMINHTTKYILLNRFKELAIRYISFIQIQQCVAFSVF
jgi:hypothetical protein